MTNLQIVPSVEDELANNEEPIQRSIALQLGATVRKISSIPHVRSGVKWVTTQISERRSSSNNGEHEIEQISAARLNNMVRHCMGTHFSCHSESTSNGTIFHAIFLPDSKSVWKSTSVDAVRLLCNKLDPLGQFPDDQIKISTNLGIIMPIVRENLGWDTSHYAIAAGCTRYLALMIQERKIVLDQTATDDRYPLHIAAENSQVECLKLLISAFSVEVDGGHLTQCDSKGRTIAHWAATSSVKMLETLMSYRSFPKCLFVLDNDGFTPLAWAVKASNYETVQFLLDKSAPLSPFKSTPPLNVLLGLGPSESLDKILEKIVTPEVARQVDKKGRTVFHNDLHPRILDVLLRKVHLHVDLNQKDNSGSTPLHLAVLRGDFDSVVLLLTHGAKVNEPDGKGRTPLMLAAAKDNVLIVKTLLVFHADISLKSLSGHGVFNYLSNGKNRGDIEKCLALEKQLPRTLNDLEEDFGQKLAIERASGERREVYGLSLDGGGIRGLVLIQMLIEIEKNLGPNDTIMNYFNWIAGTSTGAILALALSQGKSLTYCRDLYFKLKDQVFIGTRPYSAISLESLLKQELGESTSMEDIAMDGKRVMVTTCENISPLQLHLIRSYEAHSRQTTFTDPKNTPAWLAARCSSAAPTYFPMVGKKYMDGGLIANNPCCELLTEIQNYNTSCQNPMENCLPVNIGCVLSLGTGKAPIVNGHAADLDLPSKFHHFDKIVNTVNYGVHFLKHVLIEQVTCADGVAVDRARAWCHSLSTPFFRFSPQLTENIDLAETKNDVLIEMLWQTKVYMATEKNTVDELISLLKHSQR